jgi:hypothetical protein
MNPFSHQQELRFARVAARVTRKLPPDAQSEVFATAYLKARESYGDFDAMRGDGTIESRLDSWFFGLALNAKKKIRREYRPLGASEALETLVAADNPEAEAIRSEVFEKLTTEDLAIMAALEGGASVRQAARKCKASVSHVKQVKRRTRIKLLQIAEHAAPAVRREPTGSSDDDMREAAPIDHEIERMLRRPATSKADCPVCWRCSWFDGLLPVKYAAKKLADAEITEAILRTELRKQDIANKTAPRDAPEDRPEIDATRKYRKAELLVSYSSRRAWQHIVQRWARPLNLFTSGVHAA